MNVESQVRMKLAEAGLPWAGFRGFQPRNKNRGTSYPAGAARDGTATLSPRPQDGGDSTRGAAGKLL